MFTQSCLVCLFTLLFVSCLLVLYVVYMCFFLVCLFSSVLVLYCFFFFVYLFIYQFVVYNLKGSVYVGFYAKTSETVSARESSSGMYRG